MIGAIPKPHVNKLHSLEKSNDAQVLERLRLEELKKAKQRKLVLDGLGCQVPAF